MRNKKGNFMLDLIHSIFSFIISASEFILFTVFVKMIFAKWVGEKIIKWLQTKNYRNAAIWEHYNQAHGGEVEECTVGKCVELHQAPAAIPSMA
jgi:hypothetical protein